MSAICMDTFRRPSIQYESIDDDDDLQKTIRLQLKKPKDWNWELTTSKSSPNIAFPRVLLYNDKGELLADAQESDSVFRSRDNIFSSTVSDPGKASRTSSTASASTASKNKKKRRLSSSSLKQLQSSLSDFIDQLNECGIECRVNDKLSEETSERSFVRSKSDLTIEPEDVSIKSEQNLSEAPSTISVYSERGLLQRDWNTKEFDHLRSKDRYRKTNLSSNDVSTLNDKSPPSGTTQVKEVRFNLQKSQSALEVPNLREREKRKCRRSKSTEPSKFSGSILERMRAFKERSSSSEEQDLQISYVDHGPRYFLRTCRAGTLVICEESFRHKKIRRRPVSIARISEAEETDSKTAPEKIVQKIPCTEFIEQQNKKNEFVSSDVKIENLKSDNRSCSTKSLAIPNDENNREIKTKKRKKMKKLRRCVSAGTLLLSTSSDDDCSQTSNRSANFRQKRKTSTKNKKEKGDQILTLNNNSSTTNTKQQAIGPSADIIDEKSGSNDEALVEFVHHLTVLKEKKNVFDKNEHILSLHRESLKSQDENCNANYSQLGQCHHNIKNFLKDSSYNNNNTNNNNLKVNSVNTNKNFYSKDFQEYSKNCDNNNNSSENDNENDDVSKEYDEENAFDNHIENGVCVLSETTTCSDSETVTVLNFNQNINKKSANDRRNFVDINYNNNMGSNVSRNSGKGLSGRRTQSSGNLYSEKHGSACSYPSNLNPNDKLNSTLPPGRVSVLNGSACKQEMPPEYMSKTCHTELIIQPLGNVVTKKDRNKFCGSLPNHLDVEDESNEGIQQLDEADTITILDEEQQQDRYVPVAPPRRQHLQQQQQQQQQLNLSSNTLSSGVESTITHPGSDSFTINQVRPDIQLKLPLVRSNPDPSCDQGYGSERSPEDELPPPMPDLSSNPFQFLQNYNMDWDYGKCINNPYCYSFITKDCTFSLQITKGSRGLGLSISGGIDSNAPFPGLIRIKRLFPHQPAWATGKLQPGDIILEVNEVPLTGLTNYEALEVLRTMPSEMVLLICRPSDEEYKKLSPPADPPKPPSRTTQQQSTQTLPEDYPLEPLAALQTNFTGEFEIIMVKQQGSLGFTLRKEDESVLGHYVRALVREPATTDGRIKPGDKIVAVNDVPLSPMTHEQAVIFLRQAADTVKLRLYRDEAQTPVAAMSPTTENKTFCNTSKKTLLRPEAINLLSDLAQKKQTTPGDSTESSLKSNNTSPRRLRRANKQNSGNNSQSEHDTSDSKSSSNHQYIVSSQSASLCSDSEQSVTSQCSYRAQSINPIDDELFKTESNDDRPDRPNFLDLAGQSGSTPVVSRKPRFQFTIAANAHELNNFENESMNNDNYDDYVENIDELPKDNPHQAQSNSNQHEFTSLPCETFLIACKTESDLKDEENFSYKNPMYQSAHVQTSQTDETPLEGTKKEGNSSLLKWKGVVLSPDSEEEKKLEAEGNGNGNGVENGEGGDEDTSCTETPGSDSTVKAQKSFNTKNTFPTATALPSSSSSSSSTSNAEGHKIICVELNRGWNSRLGFSLQLDSNTKKTVISAIYSDSVAAKDGRLRVGDQLLTVNDESVEDMPTTEIIDLLRILRGSIVITVLRKNSS